MADARPQDFIDSLQELLTNNITDPNTDRTGRWIYNTSVSFDLPQYPRMHISKFSNQPEWVDIGRNDSGSIRQQNNNRIQIVVLNNEYGEFDVDGDSEKERPNDVLDYLVTEVQDLIKNNQDRWRAIGDQALHFFPLNDEPVETSKDSVIAHVVEAEIANIRGGN